jgi:hypothetical protein
VHGDSTREEGECSLHPPSPDRRADLNIPSLMPANRRLSHAPTG